MKYIKPFESQKLQPIEGDWVIMTIDKKSQPRYKNDPELLEFLEKTPGEIYRIETYKSGLVFKIKFDNIPLIISDRFTNKSRTSDNSEILMHAKTKEELEKMMLKNKFNI